MTPVDISNLDELYRRVRAFLFLSGMVWMVKATCYCDCEECLWTSNSSLFSQATTTSPSKS